MKIDPVGSESHELRKPASMMNSFLTRAKTHQSGGGLIINSIMMMKFCCTLTLLLLLMCDHCMASDSSDITCSKVKYAYASKGLGDLEVPQEAISGENLKICKQEKTCCTQAMEHKLSTQSRAEFDKLLTDLITEVRNVFASRSQKFDEFFRELFKTSKKDFHEMFLATYGVLYDQNSHIFTDLFEDLEKYYATGVINLSDSMFGFFQRLYQKMFQVLNSQYTFSSKYLMCVSEHMEALKPFGDIPRKLTVDVKRSFVATRTFVQALAIGKEVVKNIMEVRASPECSRALMNMMYCPHCRGMPDLKPCSNYCLNVMKGCLAYHAELDNEWNSYIDALMDLANRLESSFNIETVVDPLDIKISEAIMNFQENGNAISDKLFEGCGKPRFGKRDVRHEINFETLKFSYQPQGPRPTTAAGTSMDRLMQDIRKKIKRTKNFWTRLPNTVCNHPQIASAIGKHESCWNGVNNGSYRLPLVGDGLENQKHNPELNMDATRQNSIITQQNLTLHLITAKLKYAFNGLDVEWPDSESIDDESSGSGSGSGYGEEPGLPSDTDGIYFSTPEPKRPRFHPDLNSRRPSGSSGVRATWSYVLAMFITCLLLTLRAV